MILRTRVRRTLSVLVLACALGACSDDFAPLILETTLVADTDDAVGPYEIASIVRDDTGVSAAWVFYSVDGKQVFETAAMSPAGVDAWRGRLPGFPVGTRVDYYVAARDRSANIGTDPVVAPASTHCFLVGRMPSRPRILLVSPGRGPATGGTLLSIFGQDFRPGARVFLETTEATQVTVIDSTLITALTPPGAAGLADVVVENPAGRGPADSPCRRIGDTEPVRVTAADAFLYVEPPRPMRVVPDRGPTAGGTTITLVGTGFAEGATVTLDGVAGRDCVRLSDTQLRCVTPPGDPGPADVRVVNPDGLEGSLPAGFRYVPPPEVFSIEPPRGPDAGGTAFTVRGRGFEAGAIVLFDNVDQTDIVLVDERTLTARSKPHPVGFVDVRVRNLDGQEARLSRGFFYYGPPRITSIVPDVGPTSGGQRVTISGESFVPGLSVTFDGLPVTELVSVTENELIVITPPHPEAVVRVVVTNPDNRSAETRYRYVPAPDLSGLMPTCGPASGGTTVTIVGLNFQAGAVVLFDDIPSPMSTVVSPAVINAVTPARPGGVAQVRVRNPDGGLSLSAGRFTFVARPRVLSASPQPLLLCGGDELTLTGESFLPGAEVTIGGRPCTNVRLDSATSLRCTAPALPAGPQPIVVTNVECLRQASDSAVSVRYEAVQLSPTGGLIAGFTRVQVRHARGLAGRRVAQVRFGGRDALEVTNQATLALAQSPPNPVGDVPVEVTLEGCSPETAAQRFSYRVFVDQTERRLPKPQCSPAGGVCQGAHLEFGDLNGDGLPDLVQANGGIATEVRQSNQLFFNNPMQPGVFVGRNMPDAPGGAQNTSRVDLADIDGDGDLDIIVANDSSGGELWLNDGQGGLSRAPFSSVLERLPSAFDAQFVDVNNDGRKDIVYLEIGIDENNGVARNGPDHVYLNRGGGNFTEVTDAFPATVFSVHDHKMAFGKFNNDDFIDMIVVVDSHFQPRPIHRMLNGDGQGRFSPVSAPALERVFGDVFGIEVGDFNGDGRDDVFLPVEGRVIRQGSCQFVIQGAANVLLLNDGMGGLTDRSDLLPAANDPTIGAIQLDVDGDGDLDLVALNFGVASRILVNEGNGRFHDASDALRDPPLCSLSAASAVIDRGGIPALAIGGNFETRIWVQTAQP